MRKPETLMQGPYSTILKAERIIEKAITAEEAYLEEEDENKAEVLLNRYRDALKEFDLLCTTLSK